MKQKINVRLALIALIAIVATTFGLTLAYYNLFERQVRDDLRIEAELLDDTGIFQKSYLDQEQGEWDLSPDMFQEMQSENLRITWIDANGTVLYDNDADASNLENHADRPEVQEALENGSGSTVRRSDTLNMNTYYYALLLDDGTVLRVSTTARSIASIFMAAFPFIALIVVAIILVCVWLSHLLTKQLLLPIEQMAENLDDTVEEPVYKELIPFADKIRSQHENLLAAVKSRQDFTASVSHELKTPLTAISGYAELIENKMVTPEQEITFSRQIRNQVEHLLTLINDIIQLTELDHKELNKQRENVDLYQLAAEVCKSLQVNAGKKEIYLTCSGSSIRITAEKNLLVEMITNLVQNAIQYNNVGGRVSVMVRYENNAPCLIVSDNGIGIPKESQEHIFERFYRVDKSRSKATGGTGLGLAIVKHIAEIHDASIELESQEGRGTTIKIIF